MFQSSRIASGNWRLQASSACSPSSASSILKSSPSRIRRATLRMTLESSTTKQVFIIVPHHVYLQVRPANYCQFEFKSSLSCSSLFRAYIKHAIDIDQQQQLPVQAVY